MLLFGVNFNVYVFMLLRRFRMAFRQSEVWCYFSIVGTAIIVVALNTLSFYDNAAMAFHHAAFSVSSIITTTGFATVDFNLWPELSRIILVLLMVIGACAGSTGGGMKVSRIMILGKACRSEVGKLLNPREV